MVNFSPDAVGEVLLLLPELAAAWLLVVLELLGGVEEVLPPPPHAASPTTAAAASPEAANHRLRIVSTPFATVTRSAYTRSTYVAPESFRPRRDRRQAAIRWQSHASESGYRYSMPPWPASNSSNLITSSATPISRSAARNASAPRSR